MRNLTRLVLLISFGILAALPFRYNSANPSDPSATGEATGPTPADLGRSNLEFFAQPSEGVQMQESLSSHLPTWTVPENPSNTPPIPASFEEIAVPLRLDSRDKQRLSVMATQQMHTAAKPEIQSDVAEPRFAQRRSLPQTGDQQSKFANTQNRFGTSFQPRGGSPAQHSVLSASGNATQKVRTQRNSVTTLASTDVPIATSGEIGPPRAEQLPPTSTDQRTRHWIRQPD